MATGKSVPCLDAPQIEKARCLLEGSVKVEALRTLGLVPGLQAPEQITDLVLPEAGERTV
jgi:hypothetical protein